MSELGVREKLTIELTHSREEALCFGDDLLVYLLSMAVLHVQKKSDALRETSLCQFGNEVDRGGAKRRIVDSLEGVYQT